MGGPDRGCTAWLRVYEPLAAFDGEERERYAAQAAAERRSSLYGAGARESAWARRAVLRTPPEVAPPEEVGWAALLDVDGVTHASPSSLRLRCLTALEEWSTDVSAEVAAAFVPPAVLEQASLDLEAARTARPDASLHALVSPWVVPLRWFVCFEPSERRLVQEEAGTTLVYRTAMARARRRVARAFAVLRQTLSGGSDEPVVGEVAELGRWLEEFHPRSWVELDYGGVGDRLAADDEDLDDEDSVSDIAAALGALHEGDADAAGTAYARVAGRWQQRRALEAAN